MLNLRLRKRRAPPVRLHQRYVEQQKAPAGDGRE
jgi:hypothetical protein